MTSWKKKIKLRFGRHSGDVSPPTTLIDDLPPPFARSMSLRHPGYATRDGDLRPDSILLFDDQRIPTLRRTWSFRQAVTHKGQQAGPTSSPHPGCNSYQKPVIFHGNYTGTGTVPECPPSPTKPAFFSRLFRFSLRDKQKKGVLPPSVAHVDVIRTGDPERHECNSRDGGHSHGNSRFSGCGGAHDDTNGPGGSAGGGGFSAAEQQLSQWPSVQSDIVAMNDGVSTGFISQWASVPTDMTSAAPAVVKGQPQHLPASPEWSSVDNEIDDEDDKDVVVIRRCTTLPSFRIRSRSDISCPSSRAGLEQDSLESNSSLPLFLKEGHIGHNHHQHSMSGLQQVDQHAARQKQSKRKSREVLQDEFKYVLLNGTYPPLKPQIDEMKPRKPHGLIVDNPSNAPVQLIESPCSDDSAVGDLSPVNHLLNAPEASNDKFTVDSTIFETIGIKAGTSGTPNNANNSSGAINSNSICSNVKPAALRKLIGPTIELEDPKTTRRRFESRLPNSCRPASVSPVRDPAVIRRVKKNTVARPVSYTPGLAFMQRASTDLTRPLLYSSTAERASSAEALVGDHSKMDLAAEKNTQARQKRSEPTRKFGSMQDVHSRPITPSAGKPNSQTGIFACSESRAVESTNEWRNRITNSANLSEQCADERTISRQSSLSDEVDSGTFIRKKPVPLQRSETFTKEDSTAPVEELPVVDSSVSGNSDVSGKVKDLQRDQPVRKSLRRELRKPSEVAKVKELNNITTINPNNNINSSSSGKDIIKDEGAQCGSSAGRNSSSAITKYTRKSKTKQIFSPVKLDPPSPTGPLISKNVIACKESPHKSSKLPMPGSFVRGTTQNSSRRQITLPIERQTSIESTGRSAGSIAGSPETPEDGPPKVSNSSSTKELISPSTPKGSRSRIAAPSKIARAGRSKNSGLRLIAKSPAVESVGQQSPSVIEDASEFNRTFDIIATSQPPYLVESVSRVAEEARQQIRSAMNGVANPPSVSPSKDTLKSTKTTTITITATTSTATVTNVADCTPPNTNCPTSESSPCDVNGLDDRNVPKAVRATENTTSTPITATSQSQNGLSVTGDARISPAKSEFENEILRLGETCEARSVELTVIRSELRRSSVAFSAMALAAQYWSERLKRTEGYSQQLKGQLQMAEKVILKAHNDIENLKKELRDEVCARRRDVEDFEQTRDHKLADLEQKHAAAVALLEKDFGRRLEEALEKERQKAESANDEVVSKRQLEELKIEHARALERLKACRAEEINALTDAQQDLERRLVEKTSQCRRVEEEAVALKDKLLQSADSQAQWLTKKVASLEKEVESLNAVLELKTAETRELMLDRRENQERKEKMVTMQEVIDKHRARIEDLTAQLDRKTAVQQQLTAENVKLHELSAKKDRIITQLDHDFEALKYRARDSNSFIVDVATPTHRPLQESRSVGAAATTPEADGVMSRSWHVPFGDARSARRINRRTSRKSSSSESKVSDEDSRVPTALDEVFSHEEQVVLGETVGSGQVAVSRA